MSENWCSEHETAYFKKGGMKSYAHPIKNDDGETTGWCNKPKDADEPEGTKTAPKPKPQTIQVGENRNRSFPPAYSKDLVCALIDAGKQGQLESLDKAVSKIIEIADKFEAYLTSGKEVKDGRI